VNHSSAVGGKPIPVSHMTLQAPLQQQGTAIMTAGTQSVSGAPTVIKQQQQQPQPVVAKVLTGAQGQMISMESLLAHQKQHGTLPQGVFRTVCIPATSPYLYREPHILPLFMLTHLTFISYLLHSCSDACAQSC